MKQLGAFACGAALVAVVAWAVPATSKPKLEIPGYEIVVGTPGSVQPVPVNSAQAVCPPGKVVLGGGMNGVGTSSTGNPYIVELDSSYPVDSRTWRVTGHGSEFGSKFTPYAICADQ